MRIDETDVLDGADAADVAEQRAELDDDASDGSPVGSLDELPLEADPADVAVLDVRLPDGDGVTVCRELRSRMPELKVVMLTSYSDDEALFEAIMAGASGYLLKQILGQDLVAAVRTVGAGGSLLDPTATAAVLDRIRRAAEPSGPAALLSDQERTVLDFMVPQIISTLTSRLDQSLVTIVTSPESSFFPPDGDFDVTAGDMVGMLQQFFHDNFLIIHAEQ